MKKFGFILLGIINVISVLVFLFLTVFFIICAFEGSMEMVPTPEKESGARMAYSIVSVLFAALTTLFTFISVKIFKRIGRL